MVKEILEHLKSIVESFKANNTVKLGAKADAVLDKARFDECVFTLMLTGYVSKECFTQVLMHTNSMQLAVAYEVVVQEFIKD